MSATTTTPRARLPRTFAALSSHPWVYAVDDERKQPLGDGVWVYLKPGFVWDGCTSHIHEPTIREACQAFRQVAWDPVAWGHACGASAAEVAALTGEATPAEATPADAAPAPEATPARAETVRDVERRDGGGVAVICSGSAREAFRLPDTVSHCGAAAALEAAGWILSPELQALAQRWRDLSGNQQPSAEAIAIAEAAAPQGRRFEVFHRTWWRKNPGWPDGREPGAGIRYHVGWAQTEARARYMCRRWNASHDAGPLDDRAEYSAV